MSNTRFENLILPPPPLPTASASNTLPQSGNGNDFQDALDRAGQPPRQLENDQRPADHDRPPSRHDDDLSANHPTYGRVENPSSRLSRASREERSSDRRRRDDDDSRHKDAKTVDRNSNDRSSNSTTDTSSHGGAEKIESGPNATNNDQRAENSQNGSETGKSTQTVGTDGATTQTNTAVPVAVAESDLQCRNELVPQAATAPNNPTSDSTVPEDIVGTTRSAEPRVNISSSGQQQNPQIDQLQAESEGQTISAAAETKAATRADEKASNQAKTGESIGAPSVANEAAQLPVVQQVADTGSSTSFAAVAASHVAGQGQFDSASASQASNAKPNRDEPNAERSRNSQSANDKLQPDIASVNLTAQPPVVAVSHVTTGAFDSGIPDSIRSKGSSDSGLPPVASPAGTNQSASLARNSTATPPQQVASNSAAQLYGDGRKAGTPAPIGPQGAQNSIDQGRFVQRVARAFRSIDEQGGQIRLRLSPPELGSLKVEVALRNGVMTAKLEAETTSARNLLLNNLPALRERLADQNIKIERFDVDLRQDTGGGGSANASPDFAGFRGAPATPQSGGRNRVIAASQIPQQPPVQAARTADGRINIVV